MFSSDIHASPSMSLATVNPYSSNEQLSSLEQDVLWEYAKLGDKIKRISNLAKLTAENPNESLLAELRILEKKMGLVLTLFKSAVWGVMQDHEAAQAEAEQVELARREVEERERERQERERYRGQEDSYDRSDDSIDEY